MADSAPAYVLEKDPYGRASVFAWFYDETQRNDVLSKELGKPSYDTVTFARIKVAGDNGTEHVKELERTTEDNKTSRPGDYERFENALRAWRERTKKKVVSGTPIENWPLLDMATVATLKELGIDSVEALRDASGDKLDVLGVRGIELQEQAAFWIGAAQDANVVDGVRAENDRLNAENKDLKAKLAEANKALKAAQKG